MSASTQFYIYPFIYVGGILTLALACGKTPKECQGLYYRLKDKVFVGKRPYDVAPLEDFLKKEFSENMTMASLPPKPRYLISIHVLLVFTICMYYMVGKSD